MKKFIVLLIVLCTLTSTVLGLTRGNIEDEIRRITNDTETDTTKRAWSDTILDARIEMAQIDITQKTWCLCSRAVTTTTVSTAEYVLPTDSLAIDRVALESTTDGQYEKLQRRTVGYLDKKQKSWEGLSDGKPAEYYERRNRIGLVPPPKSTYAGDEKLKVDYVEFPDALADDDSVPLNGWRKLYPYHELIIWYVSRLCFIDRGKLNQASYFEALYNNGVEEMRKELNIKPDRSSQATADYN